LISDAYFEAYTRAKTTFNACNRIKKFEANNEDLSHKKRAGRPREVDHDAVFVAIEKNPSLTCD
jgi:cell fate (sporulation/competence/biofilm development) regulator YlbF (YheA/YmcA/DUF963 family)